MELNNVVRNIFVGVNPEVANDLLKQPLPVGINLAILLQGNETAALNRLYNSIAASRTQKVIFVLLADTLTVDQLESAGRFFFLPNYCHLNNSPLLFSVAATPNNVSQVFKNWCAEQSFGTPEILAGTSYTGEHIANGKITYVPVEHGREFLATLLQKITKMEWLSKKIIFQATAEKDVLSLLYELSEFSERLIDQNRSLYEALAALNELEKTLVETKTTIRFQEMEIANLKLYNRLIKGEEVTEFTITPANQEPLISDITNLKNERTRLLADIGRLRNDLAWYKRTYEERSLMGLLKEKILKNFWPR